MTTSSKPKQPASRGNPKVEITLRDMGIHGGNAPDYFVTARGQGRHQRDTKHGAVGAIRMRISVVYLLSARIKNFNATCVDLNHFTEPNTHLGWRFVYFASNARLGSD